MQINLVCDSVEEGKLIRILNCGTFYIGLTEKLQSKQYCYQTIKLIKKENQLISEIIVNYFMMSYKFDP